MLCEIALSSIVVRPAIPHPPPPELTQIYTPLELLNVHPPNKVYNAAIARQILLISLYETYLWHSKADRFKCVTNTYGQFAVNVCSTSILYGQTGCKYNMVKLMHDNIC